MHKRIAATITAALLAASCGSSESSGTETTSATETTSTESAETTEASTDTTAAGDTETSVDSDVSVDTTDAADASTSATCEDKAASFAAGPSVNPDLAAPESSATCDGDTITIAANGIPDYTYIETSPGSPAPADIEYVIPAEPEMAAAITDVPLLGSAAVSLTGIPIYGPTEGTGGDVLSLGGALSECGSHNGPTGFHIHIVDTSENTDCLFTPAEVAAAPQLVGYAFDGYPIYTGNDQYTSSWELTDESLFATDTWAAHSYVEGSGDLDECNGLTDADGNYAYYTTDTFPYVLGCYSGVVDEALLSAGGGPGGGQGRPGADEG